MHRFFKFSCIILAILIVSALAVPLLVPVDRMKEPVLTRIEAATGRKVSMSKISLSLFPMLAFKAQDVKIGNPDWAGGGDMAVMDALDIGVELMPLLHGELRLKKLTLDKPVLTLVKQGTQANWQLDGAAPQKPSKPDSAHRPGNGFFLGNVSIKNGTAVYKDMSANTVTTLTDINLTLTATDAATKATLDGSATINGNKIALTLTLANPLGASRGELSDAELTFTSGPLTFTWKGTLSGLNTVPSLTGNVTIPQLDMREVAGDKEKTSPTTSAAPASNGHWSDAPINWSVFSRADANLTITIDKLILPKTTLENIVLDVGLANGSLHLSTHTIAAYGGTITATLSADSTGEVSMQASAAGVQAAPLLQDFAHMDKLSGTLAGAIAVNSHGASERNLIANLAGTGDFHLKDGEYKGRNILAMARGITSAFTQASEESTRFSTLSGSYVIKTGIVSNSDLKLISPLLNAGGAGNVDLPNWQVHYVLKPELVATIPIRIDGPPDNPSYRPDLQAAISENLKDPKKLRENAKRLFNKNTLQGLLR